MFILNVLLLVGILIIGKDKCVGAGCVAIPYIQCNWNNVRSVCGNCGMCEDDINIWCNGGHVTKITFGCPIHVGP